MIKDKQCSFKFDKVGIETVEDMLRTCKNEPPGIDNLDSKLLKLVTEETAPPICHIRNMSFANCLCPLQLKHAKLIPLPKNKKLQFSGANSRPISLLPVLSKIKYNI